MDLSGEKMTRKQISITKEPVGALYRKLIEIAVSQSARAYLVTRLDNGELSARAMDALALLKSERIECRASSEWPGTELLNGATATVSEYRCTPRLAEALSSLASGLYEWVEPELPEDLGFLRTDGSPWLASIAHERDAFFVLSDAEAADLVQKEPAFSGLLDHVEGDIVG
jgi:hypothetical protein